MLDWLADTLLGRSLRQRYAEIKARQPLYLLGQTYFNETGYRLRIIGVNDDFNRWQGCFASVETDGLHLYPRTRQMELHVHFPRESLRWFGRPEKYQDGRNEIWLHYETGGQWHVLKIRTPRYGMQHFVRAFKQISTPEQVKAYRRMRPYIHYGPAPALPAVQDIHGAWAVSDDPLALYITPYALVGLDGAQVRRVLPLEHIQQIEVMPRLDDPLAGGVVRFRYMDAAAPETLAYTLPDYGIFGESLAEAAKRSLEDPPAFYGKKKVDKHDDDDWDD